MKKVNYKKIYSEVEKAGLIEKWIIQDKICQVEIMKGIEYLEYFLSTTVFENCKYWWNDRTDNITKICKDYAILQITKLDNQKKCFEYMKDC
jgi:hypothetical protein